MTATILVPVAVLEGETVGQGVVEVLGGQRVVLLAYHVVPEQTEPDQARLSFEEKAREQLTDVVDALEAAGAEVDPRLVFTHDREQTVERVASETDADVVLHLNPTMAVERVLVTLYGDVDVERIGRFVAELVEGRDVSLHLLEVVTSDYPEDQRAAARDVLVQHGVDPDRLNGETVESTTPVATIVEAASGFDAIVVGERHPSLSELVFGDFEERVAEGSLGPVFVVRAVDPDETGASDG